MKIEFVGFSSNAINRLLPFQDAAADDGLYDTVGNKNSCPRFSIINEIDTPAKNLLKKAQHGLSIDRFYGAARFFDPSDGHGAPL